MCGFPWKACKFGRTTSSHTKYRARLFCRFDMWQVPEKVLGCTQSRDKQTGQTQLHGKRVTRVTFQSQQRKKCRSLLEINCSQGETALCCAVLALSGTDTLVSLIPRPVPWAPAVGRPSKSAGCLTAQKKRKKNSCRLSRRTPTWPPIDKVAQEILLSICKAELKEVNGHDHEQHQASDSQTQLTIHQSRRQLLISSLLQTREDVQ